MGTYEERYVFEVSHDIFHDLIKIIVRGLFATANGGGISFFEGTLIFLFQISSSYYFKPEFITSRLSFSVLFFQIIHPVPPITLQSVKNYRFFLIEFFHHALT